MLQFVNPIWLAAGIGIIIPVIIHLWNVRKGKVLRIGSTLLMSDATQQTTSSLRLSQWLLLLLRCLMILFLAMLMAGPEWHANKQQTGKGWVLIDKKDFRMIYRQFKSPIDSLLSKGYELHAADKSLERINAADSLEFVAETGDSTRSSSSNKSFSYWSMLQKADRILPAGFPVYFFSNDKLADAVPDNLSARPRVSIDLRWQMIQSDRMIASVPASTSTPASPSIPVSKSIPASTSIPASPPIAASSSISASTSIPAFRSIPAFARQLSTGGYQLNSFQPARNGSHFIKSFSQNPPVNFPQTDTSTLLITIYNDKFSEDLRYLQAAIHAIADFGNYKLVLNTVDDINNIPKYQHWLFWLSNKTPSENLSTENLFIYQPGKPVKTTSWLSTSDGGVSPGVIKIYQRITDSARKQARETNLNLLWKDGYGNALLTLESSNDVNEYRADHASDPSELSDASDPSDPSDPSDAGKAITGKRTYRFYTRFHPAWSDLSWNPDFPKLLFPFIIRAPEKDMLDEYDESSTEVADVIPTVIRETYKDKKSAFELVELTNLFWLITFVLFATERIISINSRNTKKAANA